MANNVRNVSNWYVQSELDQCNGNNNRRISAAKQTSSTASRFHTAYYLRVAFCFLSSLTWRNWHFPVIKIGFIWALRTCPLLLTPMSFSYYLRWNPCCNTLRSFLYAREYDEDDWPKLSKAKSANLTRTK